jgi:hypothetical protein
MADSAKGDGRLVFDCLSAVLLLAVAILGRCRQGVSAAQRLCWSTTPWFTEARLLAGHQHNKQTFFHVCSQHQSAAHAAYTCSTYLYHHHPACTLRLTIVPAMIMMCRRLHAKVSC